MLYKSFNVCSRKSSLLDATAYPTVYGAAGAHTFLHAAAQLMKHLARCLTIFLQCCTLPEMRMTTRTPPNAACEHKEPRLARAVSLSTSF